jgi:hypothetical protein
MATVTDGFILRPCRTIVMRINLIKGNTGRTPIAHPTSINVIPTITTTNINPIRPSFHNISIVLTRIVHTRTIKARETSVIREMARTGVRRKLRRKKNMIWMMETNGGCQNEKRTQVCASITPKAFHRRLRMAYTVA